MEFGSEESKNRTEISLPSNSDLPDPFKKYKKLEGTRDYGREYEQAMCAYYALTLSIREHVHSFEMSSNNSDHGKFDDLGVRVTFTSGIVRTYLFQLKHKNKNVNMSDLRSQNDKHDFSVKKYIRCISQMDVKEETVFILFTNSATKIKGKQQVSDDLSMEGCSPSDSDLWLNTNGVNTDDVLFVFKSEMLKQKFLLLTSQMSVRRSEETVNAMLKNLLQCDVHGAFSNYVKTWWSGKFILTKHAVLAKVTELALAPYLKPLTAQKRNDKTDSLKRAITCFPLTLVEECDDDIVEHIWDHEQSWTGDQSSKAKEKYGLKDHQEDAVLWYLGKLPLVVKVDRSNEGIIKSVMNLLRRDVGNKRVVLCGRVRTDDFGSWDALESLWDIVKKCREEKFYGDIMRNFRMSLQGRDAIALATLVVNDEDVAKLIGLKDLLKMSQREYLLVGDQKEALPAFHIPRTVSSVFMKTEHVLRVLHESDDALLILNWDAKFGSKLLGHVAQCRLVELSKYINETTNEKRDKVIILSAASKCTLLQFEKVCQISKKRDVYLFEHFDDDYYILMLQNGRELTFETTNRTKAVKEREIFKHYNNPLHVICAPPGMGKSTLMNVLYGTCPSDCLAVHVSLISCNPFLARQPTFEEMLGRFLQIDGMEKHFLFKQLQQHFCRKQKLYMFLDGLDEVDSQYVEQILNFAKLVSSEGVNIWVSSRENLREIICEKLSVVPIEIKELDRQEQAGFISSKLARNYKEQEIEKIKMAVFQSTNLNGSRNLLGIPLQLHIITEMFLHDRKSFEDLEKKNFFVLSNMYRIFFEGKIRFAWKKLFDESQRKQLGCVMRNVLQGYELLALRTCLNHQDYQKLNLDEDEDFLHDLKAEGDKYGIIRMINQNDEAIFDHQTYAEYFACVWLKRNRRKIGLLRDAIFTEKYDNLRLIFDVTLAENNPLHLAVIYEDPEQVEAHIGEIGRKDEGGRSVLHLAFSYGQKYKPVFNHHHELRRETPFYAKIVDRLLKENETKFEDKDALFDFDCARYAFQSRCLYPIERMLEKELLTFDRVKESLESYDAADLVLFTAACGYPNLFHLIKENLRHLRETNTILTWAIRGCPDDVCTPPREGNVRVVRTIIDNYKSEYDSGTILNALNAVCSYKYFDLLEILMKNDARCEDGNTVLHLLVRFCRENYYKEVVDVVIKFKMDVNARNDEDVTAVHIAAETADSMIVEALMENGADFNVLDRKGRSALHYAARFGTESTMKLLLSKGLAVDARDLNGATPLHLAVQSGRHINNIKMLLKYGADPNFEDNGKDNALHHAVNHSSEDTIELLIEAGVNINAQNGKGRTALHLMASDKDAHDFVKLLLKYGADPNIEDNEENNALHHALTPQRPSEDTIKNLIEAGVDINAQNVKGRTALHLASEKGEAEVVKLLLKYGADPNLEDNEEDNALHCALNHPLEDTIGLLIEAGVDIDAQNQKGRTALHLASVKGDAEVVRLLLKYGADPNLEDAEKDNALHHFVKSGSPPTDTIRLLIEARVNVNAQNEKGRTALHLASEAAVVKLLLKCGADPHLEDNKKNNALHHFVRSGSSPTDTIELLIEAGVNVNAQNEKGRTALHLASDRGEAEVVELLLKYGADPNLEDNEKCNALQYVLDSWYPSKNTIDLLIEAGVNINVQNESQIAELKEYSQDEIFETDLCNCY